MGDYTTSIDIAAPPEVVFEHLVDAKAMVSWMGQHAELDPTPGGGFAVNVNGTPIRGRYLELDPPHRAVVSWGIVGNEEFPPGSSRVEFTLTATTTGTRLNLVHRGLIEPWASGHASGWTHYLTRLQTAASGTDPGADLFAGAGR
ncbi:MAG: SRPBCC family protein [Terriglobales bacterium]